MSITTQTTLFEYNDFLTIFDDTIKNSDKTTSGTSIALIDIDWFGKINEEHGRDLSDAIIGHLAQVIWKMLKNSGRVFRYGGDAFMLLFESLEKEEAFLRVEDIRKQFDFPQTVSLAGKDTTLDVTISCGVAAFPDDGSKSNEIIRKCSEALYRAKISGRNKVSLAREEKMVTKTTHYTTGQLDGLQRLAKREKLNEATLLREALDDILRKYNS
jgi:diguanylate cyclase (GGDEF)-like protein